MLLRNATFPGPRQTDTPREPAAPRTLIEEIDAFKRRTGMADNQIGIRACDYSYLVGNIRRGMNIKPATEAKLRRFLKR